MTTPDTKVLQRLFPTGHKALQTYADWALANYPDELASSSGWAFPFHFNSKTGAALLPWSPPEKKEGSTRFLIHALRPEVDIEQPHLTMSDVVLRVDVPTALRPGGKYSIYHLRFTIANNDPRATPEFCGPLFRGYVGITKRHPFDRLKEHKADMVRGGGYTLHTAWRGLAQSGIPFVPCFQIVGFADTLKEAYRCEEETVARYTLAPVGLNAIPGGEAGIRMLHELALLKGKKLPGVAERDAALSQLEREAKRGPCAHYRRGHIRKLNATKIAWVSPCWVALKAAA